MSHRSNTVVAFLGASLRLCNGGSDITVVVGGVPRTAYLLLLQDCHFELQNRDERCLWSELLMKILTQETSGS